MTDQDPREQIDTLRRKLRTSGEDAQYVQFDADRDHLLRMSDNIRLVPSEIGDFRHLKILRHCTRMATLAPPPTIDDFRENDEAEVDGLRDEDDVEELLTKHGLLGATLEYLAPAEAIVRWINHEYDNEHTNQDYRTALRSFGRYRLKRDEPPRTLDWIPTGTSNDFDPVPSERDILLYLQDVVPMIEACYNDRDRALFAFQFEAGLRGGELYDVRVGDIFDGEHTTGVHVDGKNGERSVHLIQSLPYLQRWLDDHPGGDDDWLFCKLSSPERASYTKFLDYFHNAAERAGVSKDVTPTAFRKANTRWLVKMGFSQPRIEERQGRKRGSEHTARYMATFGEESNEKAYARLHGLEVEADEDVTETGPIECPRCHRETPREREHCMWCKFGLSYEATERLDDVQDAAVDEMVTSDSAAARQMYAGFLTFVRERPDLLPAEAQELLASADAPSSSRD